MTKFNLNHFGLRFIFSILLVFLTYNPTQYSYIHWVATVFPQISAIMALSGVVLVIGWFIYLRATMRSLGPIGLGLCALLFGCIIWLFVDLNWLSLDNIPVLTWIGLLLVSFLLALGMSWSHVRRRMTGQVDTDDVETP